MGRFEINKYLHWGAFCLGRIIQYYLTLEIAVILTNLDRKILYMLVASESGQFGFDFFFLL